MKGNRNKLQFHTSILLTMSVAFVFAGVGPAAAAEAEVTSEQAQEIKEELNTDNGTSLTIIPMYQSQAADSTVSQTPVTPDEHGNYLLSRQRTIGLEPIPGFLGHQDQTTVIYFSGSTKPGTSVTLTVRSEPIVLMGRADDQGAWEIALDISTVPAGSHAAYIQTEYKSVQSDEVKIAEFVVFSRDSISNTTWITVLVIGLGIILLLIVINIQFLYERRKTEKYTAPPIAEKEDEVVPVTNEQEMEEIVEAGERSEHLHGASTKPDKEE